MIGLLAILFNFVAIFLCSHSAIESCRNKRDWAAAWWASIALVNVISIIGMVVSK